MVHIVEVRRYLGTPDTRAARQADLDRVLTSAVCSPGSTFSPSRAATVFEHDTVNDEDSPGTDETSLGFYEVDFADGLPSPVARTLFVFSYRGVDGTHPGIDEWVGMYLSGLEAAHTSFADNPFIRR